MSVLSFKPGSMDRAELLEQLEIFVESLIEQSATQTDRIPI